MPPRRDQQTPRQRATLLVARHAAWVEVLIRKGLTHTEARRLAARETGYDMRAIEAAERMVQGR